MYSVLYAVTSLVFVASIAAYAYFCAQLSQDIKEGRLPVKVEPDAK